MWPAWSMLSQRPRLVWSVSSWLFFSCRLPLEVRLELHLVRPRRIQNWFGCIVRLLPLPPPPLPPKLNLFLLLHLYFLHTLIHTLSLSLHPHQPPCWFSFTIFIHTQMTLCNFSTLPYIYIYIYMAYLIFILTNLCVCVCVFSGNMWINSSSCFTLLDTIQKIQCSGRGYE